VFDRTGKFLRVIGKTGTGPGEFRTPHAIKFDSQGRLIVADRRNLQADRVPNGGDGTCVRRRDVLAATISINSPRARQRGAKPWDQKGSNSCLHEREARFGKEL